MPNRGLQTFADLNRTATESPPVRTQFLIFTLFGDYVMARGGKIWTSHLLELMGLLDVGERAVRSALSRMTRRKWLESTRRGRHSQYSLTAKGRALLEEGAQRIFEPIYADWDGRWQIVLYSLPERKRPARHALRTHLTWLGFGRLASGAWISPHNRVAEMENAFRELGIEANAQMFCGHYVGPASAKAFIQQCWDMEDLSNHYQDFITRYAQEYEDCCDQHQRQQALDPKFCFTRRFWLTHEFQSLPLKDPNLPPSLLPADWIGFTARELFANYRNLLGTYADQFVDRVMNQEV